jgi:hypothetical protein
MSAATKAKSPPYDYRYFRARILPRPRLRRDFSCIKVLLVRMFAAEAGPMTSRLTAETGAGTKLSAPFLRTQARS